jgi:hypothetical protein
VLTRGDGASRTSEERIFMNNDERYRQAVAALHSYMKNRKNPLNGPGYEKVVNEMFDAQDAFADEQERNPV